MVPFWALQMAKKNAKSKRSAVGRPGNALKILPTDESRRERTDREVFEQSNKPLTSHNLSERQEVSIIRMMVRSTVWQVPEEALTEAPATLLKIIRNADSPRAQIMAARALKDMGRANAESLGTLVRADEDDQPGPVVIRVPRIGLLPGERSAPASVVSVSS